MNTGQSSQSDNGIPAAHGSSLQLIRNFNQVAVRIADVERDDGAGCAGAADRAFQYCDIAGSKMCGDCIQRHRRKEAKVGRTRRGAFGLGLKFAAVLMQVDFLRTEGECLSAFAKGDRAHAQHALIKIGSGVYIFDRQYQMVEGIQFYHCVRALYKVLHFIGRQGLLARSVRLDLQHCMQMR